MAATAREPLRPGVGGPGLNCARGGTDNLEARNQNLSLVARSFGVTAEEILTTIELKQSVVTVEHPWTLEGRPLDDGMVTNSVRGYVLGLLTRDCAPVLLADRTKPIIGAAHIGHAGAFGGVIEKTIEAMKVLGSRTENLCAAIGPCAGLLDTYRVRSDFVDSKIEADPECRGFFKEARKSVTVFRFENYIAHRLRRAGISHIERSNIDVIANPQCYSARAGTAPSSLMFSGIMLSKSAKMVL